MSLALSVFGEFALIRDGSRVDLPNSKKTRALLAYLALNPRPHRRERLCDIFWDRTDDPRAALRWSLSKLRPLVNDPETERLLSDRERISIVKDTVATVPGDLDDTPLAGLDLPDCGPYQAWLIAERDRLIGLRTAIQEDAKQQTVTPAIAAQDIRFCQGRDGTMLAYAMSGTGTPIVKAANWLTHLEYDWTSPIDGKQIQKLSERHTLLRYDGRGNGLSDWSTEELNFEVMVSDLESTIEAAGLRRFPLIGLSQGAAVAIEYTARHPNKVSHLILHGGFASGWQVSGNAEVRKEREAIQTLLTSQWGSDNPSFRHLISTTFMPGATAEEVDWFSDFQRKTTSAENVSRFMTAFGGLDVRARLKRISVPTLVTHSRGDQIVSMDEARKLTAGIPGARFLSLESENHSLIDREPASQAFLDAAFQFIAEET